MFGAIWKLMVYYSQREDLQTSFPEVKEGNLKAILRWASFASQDLLDDKKAFEFLKNNSDFYYYASKYENFLPHSDTGDLPKEFFILGAGRSGTTLLKRIFNCHPDTVGIEEGRTYHSLVNPYLLKLEKLFNADKKIIGLKAPAITDCLLSNDFVCFPIPGFDDKIGEMFRNNYDNQPIVFLYRDVRDRVSSMINLGKRTGVDLNGLEKVFENWIKKNQYIQNNFSDEISKIKKCKKKIHVYEALDWKVKTSALFEYKERGYPLIEIKYESLVSETEKNLEDITRFLEIPFDKQMLEFNKMPHPGLRSIGIDSNLDNTRRKTDKDSIGNYKKHLTDEEINEVMDITEDLMSKLGY